MRHGRRPLAIALAALILAGDAAALEPGSLVDYTGAELFERFCASCHGPSGRGDGPVARGLKTVVPDLTKIAQRYGGFPAARIAETIDGRGVISEHGTRAMPVWGYEFWVEEGADVDAQREMRAVIAKLVEQLRSIQAEPAGR